HTPQLIDRKRKNGKHGGAIVIPVTAEPYYHLVAFRARMEDGAALPVRSPPRDPRQEIREQLDAAGIRLEEAPRRWERIGDIVVIRLPPGNPANARRIAA